MATRDDLLIGLDIGTSSVKAIACTPAGETLALETRAYGLERPRAGWVEQDVATVVTSAEAALRAAAASVGGRARALGLSCAMHGLALVDGDAEPLGPLLVWMDARAQDVAARWRSDGTAEALHPRTGVPVHPMLPACKLRWYAEHDPASLARAAKAASLKEILVRRWTGDWAIDWGTASGTGLFDVRARRWDPDALAAAGVAPAKLSELAPTTARRTLRPDAARALGLDPAIAVVLGSSDGALANLGTGATTPDRLAVTIGTSGAVRVVTDEPRLDPQMRTFCYAYDDERFLMGGATSSAGAVVRSLEALVLGGVPEADRYARALELAAGAERGSRGLTALPFLAGERAPWWRADLRGGLVGLGLEHGPADVLRAGFEGVVYALATVREAMRPLAPEVRGIALSGKLAQDAFVRDLVADVFDLETELRDRPEASAFGAAMAAGIAVGAVADDRAVGAMLRTTARATPDAAAARDYRAGRERYERIVEAMLPLYPA